MVRSISAPALAKLADNIGTEPIIVIEIQWVADGVRTAYADRDISGVAGKILEVSGLDNVIQVSQGGDSQQLSIKLDDTDGSLKMILDTLDIHKRPCWVYQWFEGLNYSDKFLIFSGQINTPIAWNEGDRTLSFDIVSKIEDVEIGFSWEEGISDYFDEDLVGKSWPLCFGTVNNVPSLRLRAPVQGTLAQGTGIADFTLGKRITYAKRLCCPPTIDMGWQVVGRNEYNNLAIVHVITPDPNCEKQNCVTLETLKLARSEQQSYEISPVVIFGGENFAQNTLITLNINGGLFTGTMADNVFTITGRRHPDDDGTGHVIQSPNTSAVKALCGSPDANVYLEACEKAAAALNNLDASSFFWASPGSTVFRQDSQEIVYVANLIQSTVLRVSAYRSLNGARQLITVPSDYYTVRYTDYTGYEAVTEIVFDKPLSTFDLDIGGGWEDDIYVTLTSDVGPNTVDIIEWTLDTYAPSYDQDATSFAAVKALIDNYPMHFFVPGRKNLIAFLQEVATQARCALWLKDNTFYLKYLSAEPSSDDSITEDDVLPNSLVIAHTATEDLVTKQINEWRWDYAVDKPNKLILRHNVLKYGMHEKTNDYYCYTIQDLVLKSATFWLIREANTWRRLTFRTPINKLALEPFDCVTIDMPDMSLLPFKAIVEKANFNSDSREIEFEVWTPVKAGTTTPYVFGWPADVDVTEIFPTQEEHELGLGGSGTEPNFSTVAPPGHILTYQGNGLTVNFPSPCSSQTTTGIHSAIAGGGPTSASGSRVGTLGGSIENCRKDQGQRKPSDTDDQKPEPRGSADSGTPADTKPPITIDIAKELTTAQQQAAEANRKADAAKQQAGANLSDSGNTSSEDADRVQRELENQPEPPKDGMGACTKNPGDCVCFVHLKLFTVTAVIKNVGEAEDGTPGVSGFITNGTIADGGCIGFNSVAAAQAYRNALRLGTSGFGSVGETFPEQANSSVDADLGSGAIGEDGFEVSCEDPGLEDSKVVSYSPTETAPDETPPVEEA